MSLRKAEIHLARIADWEQMRRSSQHSPCISTMLNAMPKALQTLCRLILKTQQGRCSPILGLSKMSQREVKEFAQITQLETGRAGSEPKPLATGSERSQ